MTSKQRKGKNSSIGLRNIVNDFNYLVFSITVATEYMVWLVLN